MLSFYRTSIAALVHVSRSDAACFVFVAFAFCLGIYGLRIYRKTFGDVTKSRDYRIYHSPEFNKLPRDDAMAVMQRLTQRFANQAERNSLQKNKKLSLLEDRLNKTKELSTEAAQVRARVARTSFASFVARNAIEKRTIRLIVVLTLVATVITLATWTGSFSLRIATLFGFVMIVDAVDILVLSARLSSGSYGENEVDVLQAADYVISKNRQGGGGAGSFGEVFQETSVPSLGSEMPGAAGVPA